VFRCIHVYVVVFSLEFMYNLHSKCLMKCLNEFFIDCLIFLWCRSETMDNLFSAQVHFNGGNRHLFKVRVEDTLKDLKDQLNEINQRLNPGDTRRVEDLQYARPGYLKSEKIMLTYDDWVRSMFSIYVQHRMFPRIEMKATLLRSPEDILKSLILPQIGREALLPHGKKKRATNLYMFR
jgi:hypothetical protein